MAEPGKILYTPPSGPDFTKATAVYFVEEVPAQGKWVLAIPANAGDPNAIAVPSRSGELEYVEFLVDPVPSGLLAAPPRSADRFDFETREGDGMDQAQMARHVPRVLLPPASPSFSPEALDALQRRIRELEVASQERQDQARAAGILPAAPPRDPRRLFDARPPLQADAAQARRLAGEAPPLPTARPPRTSVSPPRAERTSASAGGDPLERFVTSLEEHFATRRRLAAEEREEVDEGAPGSTGSASKGISQLRAHTAAHQRAPGRRWDHVAETASLAGAASVTAYMETCTQMRRDRLTAYLVTLLCRISTAAEEGDLERVLGRCASALIFTDQWSIDGNVELAWMLALEAEPPVLRRHPETPLVRAFPKAAAQRRGNFARHQFSQLAEPTVAQAALAAAKNWKDLREAAEKLQQD